MRINTAYQKTKASHSMQSAQFYFCSRLPGAGMKTVEKITTAKMLIDIDPVTDFARFQDCLPPLLRLQANLFGEHIPSEAEERMAVETFRAMYSGARSGFDRRKSDRQPESAARRQDDRAVQDVAATEQARTNFARRKNEGRNDATLDA